MAFIFVVFFLYVEAFVEVRIEPWITQPHYFSQLNLYIKYGHEPFFFQAFFFTLHYPRP